MPDASRIRQPRDFQDTVQLHCPPDVPAPTRAIEDLAILFPPMTTERPRSSPVAVPFPDPAFAEQLRQRYEGMARRTVGEALERHAVGESKRITDAVFYAKKAGIEEGERKGYKDGWRWGLVCGLFWGAIGVTVAVQLGRHL